MRSLHSALLVSILFVFSSCDITGVWLLDWQDNYNLGCLPLNFTISEISSSGSYNISYNFASDEFHNKNCQKANITQDFSSPLTKNSTTGNWQDSLGQFLLYTESTDTIIFTSYSGILNLFSRNGTYLPIIQAYGIVSGTWVNPTSVNSSPEQYCCTPTSITFYPSSLSVSFSPFASVAYYFEVNTCYGSSSVTNVSDAQITTPDTLSPTWTDTTTKSTFYFAYNTSIGQNKLVVSYNSPNGSNCNYYFEKYGNYLTGTWYSDWQNNGDEGGSVPDSFQIQPIGGLYMTINYNFSHSQIESLIFEVAENVYFDPTEFGYYNYYPDVNSFALPNIGKIFTPTGDILNGSNYVGVWGNVKFSTGSSASSCCVPQYINITNQTSPNSPHSLSVTYYFGNSFSSTLCPGINEGDLNNGSYTDYLESYDPSPYLISWYDQTEFEISFVNASTTSEILVSPQESSVLPCSFTLTPGYVPKSALLFSSRIEIIVLITLFLLIFN